MSKDNYDEAVEIIQEAGIILKRNFGKVPAIDNKGQRLASDVVTTLDKEIETFIYKRLKKFDRTVGFKGEESGFVERSEKFWLLDPIDGTAHFIRGIPFCTTMLALIEKGDVVISVIYNFMTGDLYTAQKHKGAKLNGKTIHVSNRSLKDAYVSVESQLKNPRDLKAFLNLKGVTTIVHTITTGFEFGLIANGKIDGRICIDPYGDDYDFAAGALLVSEAGGVVANVGSHSYDYKNYNFIASNKIIYDELTKGDNPLFPIK